MCVCVCVTAKRLYHWYQITATKHHCERYISTQIGKGAKCWQDVYHLGAGLAVTGQTRDTGQNVLQFSF